MCPYISWLFSEEAIVLGSITPELKNRVTHYDVTSQVTNSKTFLKKFFELVTPCEKNFNIVLELVIQGF